MISLFPGDASLVRQRLYFSFVTRVVKSVVVSSLFLNLVKLGFGNTVIVKMDACLCIQNNPPLVKLKLSVT